VTSTRQYGHHWPARTGRAFPFSRCDGPTIGIVKVAATTALIK
jgi:hypothetical protein